MLKTANVKVGLKVKIVKGKHAGENGTVRRLSDPFVVETFDGRILYATASELGHEKFDARVRFNWGFFDGASDVRENRPLRHQSATARGDVAYALGYARGVVLAQHNRPAESSAPAWAQVAAYLSKLKPFEKARAFPFLLACTDMKLPELAPATEAK
jgi:hypothetical protein